MKHTKEEYYTYLNIVCQNVVLPSNDPFAGKQRSVFIILVEDVCKKLENPIKLIYLIYRDLKNETTEQLHVIVIHIVEEGRSQARRVWWLESGKVEGWRKIIMIVTNPKISKN